MELRGDTPLPMALRALLAAAFLVPGLFLASSAWLDHRRLNREAFALVERLSAVAKEHAQKVVETNQLVLDRLEDMIRGLDWDEVMARGEALQRQMQRIDDSIDQMAALHLVRPDGELAVISLAWPTPRTDLSGRRYMQRIMAGETGLIFGKPVRGRSSGVIGFNMARARLGPDGRMDGAVVASVLPSYFEQHWQTMDPEGQLAFTLLRADGLILAQHPGGVDETSEPPAPEDLPPALLEATETMVRTTRYGDEWLTAFRRVGHYPLFVSVTLDLGTVQAQWQRNTAFSAAVSLAAALALAFVTLLAARRFRSEQAIFARLQATADELRAEIARREAAEEELRQAQRLEALGRLTGGVAHDFNNLLTAILGTVSMLERRLAGALDERSRRLLAAAREAVGRGNRLTSSLLAFARRQKLHPAALDANALLRGFSPLLQQALGEAAPLTLDLAPKLPPCRADAAQLEAALLNLAINARDAMPRGGGATLTTRTEALGPEQLLGNSDARPGEFVAISLRDNGHGMPPEVRQRAFEPFFTTKAPGRGTGLGLSQVFGFVRQLGGHVAIDSIAGRGTMVTLYLPAVAAELPAPEPVPTHPAEETPVAPGRAIILLAEDDERVREVAIEILRDAGYRVLACADGPTALDRLRRGEVVDLLFSDIVMPGGMNGIELATEARRLRPDLPVLLASGYAGTVAGSDSPGFEVMTKPYEREALLRRLAALLTVPSERAPSA